MESKIKTDQHQDQESVEDERWLEALREIDEQREKDKSDVELFKRKASDFLIFRACFLSDKKTDGC